MYHPTAAKGPETVCGGINIISAGLNSKVNITTFTKELHIHNRKVKYFKIICQLLC